MVRTKSGTTGLRPFGSSPPTERWDYEIKEARARVGPTGTSNMQYRGPLHKGHETNADSQEYNRFYDSFKEDEQHMEFLTHSLREFRKIANNVKVRFTLDELFVEHERLKAFKDENEEDDDDDDDDGAADEQNGATAPEEDEEEGAGDQAKLPIELQGDGFSTIVTQDQEQIVSLFDNLDKVSDSTLTTVTNTCGEGALAVAIFGHVKAEDEQAGDTRASGPGNENHEDDAHLQHPVELAEDATSNAEEIAQPHVTETKPAESPEASSEWNYFTKEQQIPTVACFAGTTNSLAILNAITWDPDCLIALKQQHDDGRLVIILFGVQINSTFSHDFTEGTISEMFLHLFGSACDVVERDDIPQLSVDVEGLLRMAHEGLLGAGLLEIALPPTARPQSQAADASAEPSIITITSPATAVSALDTESAGNLSADDDDDVAMEDAAGSENGITNAEAAEDSADEQPPKKSRASRIRAELEESKRQRRTRSAALKPSRAARIRASEEEFIRQYEASIAAAEALLARKESGALEAGDRAEIEALKYPARMFGTNATTLEARVRYILLHPGVEEEDEENEEYERELRPKPELRITTKRRVGRPRKNERPQKKRRSE